jgi:hypothetical protein
LAHPGAGPGAAGGVRLAGMIPLPGQVWPGGPSRPRTPVGYRPVIVCTYDHIGDSDKFPHGTSLRRLTIEVTVDL